MGGSSYKAEPAAMWQSDYRKALQTALDRQRGGDTIVQQSRGMTDNFINRLDAQARGEGLSLAEQMSKRDANELNRLGAGALAGGQGINRSLGSVLAARRIGAAGQDLLSDSSSRRLEEQFKTQQLLGNMLAMQRGADISAAGSDIQALQALGNIQNAQTANDLNNYFASQQINADVDASNSAIGHKIAGGLIQGAAAAGGQFLGPSTPTFSGGGNPGGYGSASLGVDTSMPSYAMNSRFPGLSPRYSEGGKSDSKENAVVSPGEVIVPKDVAKDPERVKEFVAALQSKKRKIDDVGFEKVAAAQAALEDLDKYFMGGKKGGC